jgi:hypothetical protein
VIESGPTPNSVAICSPVAIDRRFGHRRWLVAANMRGPHPRVPEEWAHPKIIFSLPQPEIEVSSGDADFSSGGEPVDECGGVLACAGLMRVSTWVCVPEQRVPGRAALGRAGWRGWTWGRRP